MTTTLQLEYFEHNTQSRLRVGDGPWMRVSASRVRPMAAIDWIDDGDYTMAMNSRTPGDESGLRNWTFRSPGANGAITLRAGDNTASANHNEIVAQPHDLATIEAFIRSTHTPIILRVRRAPWYRRLAPPELSALQSQQLQRQVAPSLYQQSAPRPAAPMPSQDREEDGISEFAFAAMFPDAAPWVHPRSMWSWYFWYQNEQRRRDRDNYYDLSGDPGFIPSFPDATRQVVQTAPNGEHQVSLYNADGQCIANWGMPDGIHGRSFDFNGSTATLGDNGMSFSGSCGNVDWANDPTGRTGGQLARDDGSISTVPADTGGGFGNGVSGDGFGVQAEASTAAGVTADAVPAGDADTGGGIGGPADTGTGGGTGGTTY